MVCKPKRRIKIIKGTGPKNRPSYNGTLTRKHITNRLLEDGQFKAYATFMSIANDNIKQNTNVMLGYRFNIWWVVAGIGIGMIMCVIMGLLLQQEE